MPESPDGDVDSHPWRLKVPLTGLSHTVTAGLKHVVIEQNPLETEYLWRKMYATNIYAGRRGIGIHSMSGIDLALWDIKRKELGLPCWKLLGGGFHKKLRCYASSLFGGGRRLLQGDHR